MNIKNGNCLELMKKIEDKSVDLFICDLPYVDIKGKGETNCKWNQGNIDMEEFWKQYKRIRKHDRVACIHFCSTKFGYTLIKSWEKGFKMDMVWKKRNKTGGLCSRYRPMRNHEMVYFFYDKTPKYNRDKYHKRINSNAKVVKDEKGIVGVGYGEGVSHLDKMGTKNFDPPNPASVVQEKDYTYGDAEYFKIKGNTQGSNNFQPPNPASVVEEKTVYGMTKKQVDASRENFGKYFQPPNPASVVEEKDIYGETKKQRKIRRSKGDSIFQPPNPSSVINEVAKDKKDLVQVKDENYKKYNSKVNGHTFGKKAHGAVFKPPNPASVINEVEDEPVSMFESTKVFIGKRNHQTEKPLDILEFFLKYWTDEGDTVLDPTMGSGSTGVACKNLKRKFIGFELDPKIFEVAKKRLNK